MRGYCYRVIFHDNWSIRSSMVRSGEGMRKSHKGEGGRIVILASWEKHFNRVCENLYALSINVPVAASVFMLVGSKTSDWSPSSFIVLVLSAVEFITYKINQNSFLITAGVYILHKIPC